MNQPKPSGAPWLAERIEQRSVAELVPYARNARTHSPEQVKQIAASIARFGWTTPVLIDSDGGVVAGHGRLLAAEQLGIREVPVILVPEHWSEHDRRAYILADNKLTLNGAWDEDLLRIELADLLDSPFDIELIGFAKSELDTILNGWNPNLEAINRASEDSDGLMSTIKVKCLQDDTAAVLAAVQDALKAFPSASAAEA